jgi:hypothetical protein
MKQKMKLGLVLGSAAVGVGAAAAVIAVKSYYYREIVNETMMHRVAESMKSNYFLVDRIIDGDCLDGNPLFVGVHKQPNRFNPMSSQGIKLGETGPIKRLVSFSDKDGGLLYIFEDGTTLSFRGEKYTYKTPTCSVVDKAYRPYETIGLDTSAELDEIALQ